MCSQINIIQNDRCFNKNMGKDYGWRSSEKVSTKDVVLKY